MKLVLNGMLPFKKKQQHNSPFITVFHTIVTRKYLKMSDPADLLAVSEPVKQGFS